MRALIGGAVDLRRGEETVFALLCLQMLLAGLGNALGGTAAESLFLRTAGVALLPTFYILSDLTITAGSVFLARAARVARPATPFLVIRGGGIVAIALLWPFLGGGAGTSTGSGLAAKAPGFALYLIFQFTVVMSFIHMANFLRLYLDLSQLKRLLPVIYSVAAIGRAAGGLAAARLVGVWGNGGLVALWGLSLLAQIAAVRAFDRRVKPLIAPTRRDRESARSGAQGAGAGAAGRVWRGLMAYPMCPLMMAFTFVSIVLFRVFDYHANRILTHVYATPEQLSGFYGLFQAAGSVASIVLGSVVTPWMLRRMGVGTSLLAVPLASLACGVSLTALPGLLAAVAARTDVLVLRASMHSPVLDILTSALPQELASSLNLTLSGAVIPAASFVAGLALAALGTDSSDARVGCVALVAGLAMVALAIPLARSYERVLVQILDGRHLRRLAHHELPAFELVQPMRGRLMASVRAGDPEEALLAATILARGSEPGLAVALRDVLGDCADYRVAGTLLGRGDLVPDETTARELLARMDPARPCGALPVSPAPSSAVALVEHLAAGMGTRFDGLIDELADHPDPWVRSAAIVGLHRRGRAGTPMRARVLDDLRAREPARSAPALAAAASMEMSEALDDAAALAADRQLSLRALDALAALDVQPSARRLAAYETALSIHDAAVRERACALLARAPREAALGRFARLLDHPQPSIARQARLFLSSVWRDALPVLERAVEDPMLGARARRAIVALWAQWHQEPLVVRFAQSSLRRGFAVTARWVSLGAWRDGSARSAGPAAGPATPPAAGPAVARERDAGTYEDGGVMLDYLTSVLEQRSREAFLLAAEGLLMVHRPDTYAPVVEGLASPDPGVRSRALEALAGAVPARPARLLLPALEGREPAQIVEVGRKEGVLDGVSRGEDPLAELARERDPYLAAGALLWLSRLDRSVPAPADQVAVHPLVACALAGSTVRRGGGADAGERAGVEPGGGTRGEA